MAGKRMWDSVLPPDAFAIVMATGIVSIAAGDHGYRMASRTLAVLATALFVWLAAAGARQVMHRLGETRRAALDLGHVLRAFTLVAGTAVLGVVWRSSGPALFTAAAIAATTWLALIVLTVRSVARVVAGTGGTGGSVATLRDGSRGAWLLISVGTSGLATTAVDIAIDYRVAALLWVGIALWWVAWACYLLIAGLVLARATKQRRFVTAMTPDQWILMGALAIAALTGGHFIEARQSLAGVGVGGIDTALAWVGPATVTIWIVTTAWIPVLAAAQIVRVVRVPGALRFANVWWSAVFPLGMYASASYLVGRLLTLPLLTAISRAFTWVALAVWLAVAVGSVRALTHPSPAWIRGPSSRS